VKDNGPGIDEKFHTKIFEMFQTIKTKDEASNSGIGLAIVKKTVEHNGGMVRLESFPEKGSTFFFTIKK